MAWNKPSEGHQPPVAPKRPSSLRGLFAGLLVVALGAAVCVFCLRGTSTAPKSKSPTKPAKIAEVTPAAAPTNALQQVKPPKVKIVTYQTNDQGLIMRYENGKQRWLHWRKPPSKYGTVRVTLENPQEMSVEDIAMKGMPSSDIFLAYLYNARPGCEFGDAYDLNGFAKHFLKSLQVPIIISKDDSEKVQEIKHGVIELRKELKARYDAGEDIEAVVRDTRKALEEDYRYRQQIENEIEDRIVSGTMTQEDAEDLYGAANKMLDAKGLKNVKLSDVVRRRIERMAARRKAKLEKLQQKSQEEN